jgi:XTP/dITP diphosphohydrolase
MKLVFATANQNKVREVAQLLGGQLEVIGLPDVGITEEIPETGHTFEENALQKARYVVMKTGLPCFAEDSGLLVDVLGGEPGVFSARYAGPASSDTANIALLLQKLENKPDRKARFRCVVAFLLAEQEWIFDGSVEGHITPEPRGTAGFGYDPVFQPLGFGKTFAEMALAEKNSISHRGMAMQSFIRFLKTGNFTP